MIRLCVVLLAGALLCVLPSKEASAQADPPESFWGCWTDDAPANPDLRLGERNFVFGALAGRWMAIEGNLVLLSRDGPRLAPARG